MSADLDTQTSMAMVVIASLIGASGLGHNLLTSMDTLRLGQALEQGVAIVVIAVALDRLSQAYAIKKPVHVNRQARFWVRHAHLSIGCAYLLGSIALVPMIRYTNLGLRRVPAGTVEAATAIGTAKRQRLWKVEMPIAIPEIMLGVNQTIFMALFMVAITALIGTKNLGSEINRARSDADTGLALVAGFSIAFMGIAADRTINTWSRKRKALLGLE